MTTDQETFTKKENATRENCEILETSLTKLYFKLKK